MIASGMLDKLGRALRESPSAVPVESGAVERAAIYLDLVLTWADKINLTAITEPAEAAERLFWEAAPALPYLLDGPLLDIGTGAGFPGIPLKIMKPDLPVTLLEPRHKRAVFLREAIDVCGLSEVKVVEERLEQHARRGSHDYRTLCWRAVRLDLDDLEPLVLEPGPVRAIHWTTVDGGRDLETTGHEAWDTLHWVRMHPSRDRAVIVLERFKNAP